VVVATTWRRRVWMLGAALLAGGLTVGAARGLETHAPDPIGDENLVYLPDASRLRPLALGYDNVLADVLWFRTISYFGAHVETDRAYPWLEAMCNLVTDLDPRAFHAYQFGGLILPWEAKDPDAGIRLLEKGLAQFPDSWLLHYYVGVVHYLFKNDPETAASQLEQAAALPDAPAMVARFAALLRTRQGDPATAIAVLEQMLESTTSESTRAVLQESLVDARAARDGEVLTKLVSDYRVHHGKLPADLGVLAEAGVLRFVPPDPYGGTWVIDPSTGTVRSSTGREPMQLHESPVARSMREHDNTKESES